MSIANVYKSKNRQLSHSLLEKSGLAGFKPQFSQASQKIIKPAAYT